MQGLFLDLEVMSSQNKKEMPDVRGADRVLRSKNKHVSLISAEDVPNKMAPQRRERRAKSLSSKSV